MTTNPITIGLVKNVYVRMISLPTVGLEVKGHSHPYDHMTLLSSGAVKVTCEGIERNIAAPCIFLTGASKIHSFVATADNTVLSCIHVLRDEQGEILPDDAEDLLVAQGIKLLTDQPDFNEVT
jgi:quercetin dioxygenase-like cupin family protein